MISIHYLQLHAIMITVLCIQAGSLNEARKRSLYQQTIASKDAELAAVCGELAKLKARDQVDAEIPTNAADFVVPSPTVNALPLPINATDPPPMATMDFELHPIVYEHSPPNITGTGLISINDIVSELPAINAVVLGLTSNSSGGVDHKTREFTFLFSGNGVDFNVFHLNWRMMRVEYGDFLLNNGFKYCVMKLHRNAGRRSVTLINVVKEYNQHAGLSHQLNPKEEMFGSVMKPALYVRKHNSNHPIWAQLAIDRVKLPDSYKSWTNPIRKSYAGAIACDDRHQANESELAAQPPTP